MPVWFVNAMHHRIKKDFEKGYVVDQPTQNVIIDCAAIFYEEDKGGENYWKKNKFRCRIDKEQRSLLKLKNNVW